ncbi:MAG: NAD(P)-binding protein [Clostridiales Family XIII bacterium]|jgi:protoporphyrinogen oxidase|nr:NAD(P)-binding protein [Clostridiales Family XIII bacterium]
MRLLIAGGGLAGISLAYFAQADPGIAAIDIIEKEDEIGGLCRSFSHDGIPFDIGPHILFSKDKETLGLMLDLLGNNRRELRRSNRILHKGRFVRYPFENDLSSLPEADCARCLHGFLHNPYREYPADNMLQFFLKTFGEGITNLYLRPYNEKIWKFDPAFMDTQMTERIPRPPDADIRRSAAGEAPDGYTHQLYFSYPKTGGIAALVAAFADRLNDKVRIHTAREIAAVRKTRAGFAVEAGGETFTGELLVSCIPLNTLTRIYEGIDADIAARGEGLRHTGILIAVLTASEDRAGDNFAFMIADREVIFHRLSKLDFLGEAYRGADGTATYMLEYTHRDGDPVSRLPDERLRDLFADGLKKIGFVRDEREILSFTLKRFPRAYVIYDLRHRENMRAIRAYFDGRGLPLNGRFGNFEYHNMDRVVAESRKTAERIARR